MISFFIGIFVGTMFGIILMGTLYLSKEEEERKNENNKK